MKFLKRFSPKKADKSKVKVSLKSSDSQDPDPVIPDLPGPPLDSPENVPAKSQQVLLQFDETPTKSAKLIVDREFRSALEWLKEHPEEARIWSCIQKKPKYRSRTRRDSWPREYNERKDYSIRQLPIHSACASLVLVSSNTEHHVKADLESLIKHLAVKYPAGCAHRDSEGRMPLHEAIRCEAAVDTISVLLMACPDATTERDRNGYLPSDIRILKNCNQEYFDKVNDLLRRGVDFWEQARNEAMLRMKLNLKASSDQSAAATVALQQSLRSVSPGGDKQSLLGALDEEEEDDNEALVPKEMARPTKAEFERLKNRCFHLEQLLEEMYRRNNELTQVSSELARQAETRTNSKTIQSVGIDSALVQELQDENSDLRKRQQRLELLLRDNGLDPSDIESVSEPEGISMMGMDPERPTVLTDYMERKMRNLQGETDALLFENEVLHHQVVGLESQVKDFELKDLRDKIPLPSLESKKRARIENERILAERLLSMQKELNSLKAQENGSKNTPPFHNPRSASDPTTSENFNESTVTIFNESTVTAITSNTTDMKKKALGRKKTATKQRNTHSLHNSSPAMLAAADSHSSASSLNFLDKGSASVGDIDLDSMLDSILEGDAFLNFQQGEQPNTTMEKSTIQQPSQAKINTNDKTSKKALLTSHDDTFSTKNQGSSLPGLARLDSDSISESGGTPAQFDGGGRSKHDDDISLPLNDGENVGSAPFKKRRAKRSTQKGKKKKEHIKGKQTKPELFMNSLADLGESSNEFCASSSGEDCSGDEGDSAEETDDEDAVQSTAFSRAESEMSMDLSAVFQKEPSKLEMQLKNLSKPKPSSKLEMQLKNLSKPKPSPVQSRSKSDNSSRPLPNQVTNSVSTGAPRSRGPPRRSGSGELKYLSSTQAGTSSGAPRHRRLRATRSDDLSSMAASLSGHTARNAGVGESNLAESVKGTDDLDAIFKISAQSDTIGRSRSAGDLGLESLMASTSHLPDMSGDRAFNTIIVDTEETYGIKVPDNLVSALKKACIGVFPNVPLPSILKALYDESKIKEAEKYYRQPIPSDILSAIRSAALPPGMSVETFTNPEGASNSSSKVHSGGDSKASLPSLMSDSTELDEGFSSEPSLDTYNPHPPNGSKSDDDGIGRKISLTPSIVSDPNMDNSWSKLSVSATPSTTGRKIPETSRSTRSTESPEDFMNSLADFGGDLTEMFKQAVDTLDKLAAKNTNVAQQSGTEPRVPDFSKEKRAVSVVPRPAGSVSCIQVSPQEFELDVLLDAVAKDGVYIPYEIDVALRKASRSMDESLDFIASVNVQNKCTLFGTHLPLERLEVLCQTSSIYLGYGFPSEIRSKLYRCAQSLLSDPSTRPDGSMAQPTTKAHAMYTKEISQRKTKLRPTGVGEKQGEVAVKEKPKKKGMDLSTFLSPGRPKQQLDDASSPDGSKALVISHDGDTQDLSPMTMCSSMNTVNTESENLHGKTDLMTASKMRLQALSSISPANLDVDQDDQGGYKNTVPGLDSIPYEEVAPSTSYDQEDEEVRKFRENDTESHNGEDGSESSSGTEEEYSVMGASAELSAIIAEAQSEFGMNISPDLVNALKTTQIDPDVNDDSASLVSDASSVIVNSHRLSGTTGLASMIQDRLLSPAQKTKKKAAQNKSSMAIRLELENGLALFIEAATKEYGKGIPPEYSSALRKAAMAFEPVNDNIPLSQAFYGKELISTLERTEAILGIAIDPEVLGAFWRASEVVQHRDSHRVGVAVLKNTISSPTRRLEGHASGYFSAVSMGEASAMTMSPSLSGEALLDEVKRINGEIPDDLLQKIKVAQSQHDMDEESLQFDYSTTSFMSMPSRNSHGTQGIKEESLQFDYSATSFASTPSAMPKQDIPKKSAHSEFTTSSHSISISDIDSFIEELENEYGKGLPSDFAEELRKLSLGSDMSIDTYADSIARQIEQGNDKAALPEDLSDAIRRVSSIHSTKSSSKSSRAISSVSADTLNTTSHSASSVDWTIESDSQMEGLEAMPGEVKVSEVSTKNSSLPPEIPVGAVANIGPALLARVRKIYPKDLPLELAYVLTKSAALAQATNTEEEIGIIKRESKEMSGNDLAADLILALREASVALRTPPTASRSRRARLMRQSSASGSFRSTSRSSSMPSIKESFSRAGKGLMDPDDDDLGDNAVDNVDGHSLANSSFAGSSLVSRGIQSKTSMASTLKTTDTPEHEDESISSSASEPSINLNGSTTSAALSHNPRSASDPTTSGNNFNESTVTAIMSNTTDMDNLLNGSNVSAVSTSTANKKKKKWAPMIDDVDDEDEKEEEEDTEEVALRASSLQTIQSGNTSEGGTTSSSFRKGSGSSAIRQTSSSSIPEGAAAQQQFNWSRQSSASSGGGSHRSKRSSGSSRKSEILLEGNSPPLEGVESDDLAAIFQEAAKRF